MTYFLDFDRTLFDTDAHNRALLDDPRCASFRDELVAAFEAPYTALGPDEPVRQAAWTKVSEALISGELSYPPGSLSQYVYPDVFEFLKNSANETVIITYGEKVRQKAKVEGALADVLSLQVLYTGDVHKADFLTAHPEFLSSSLRFVDDYSLELEQMEAAFPHAELFQIRRDDSLGDGRWSVVRSLLDLP